MTDDRRKPPRAPTPDDEVVVIPPDTERSGMKPLPPEPFKLLAPPKWAKDVIEKVDAVHKRQQQMALQLDAYGGLLDRAFTSYEKRVDVFHEELALLRQTVTGNHAPRLDAVEKTVGARVRAGTLFAGKGAMYLTTAAVVARLIGKAYPQFGQSIEELLGALGL